MKLNNKILRILQNKPILTPVLDLYVNYNTLPIDKLHIQQLLVLVHRFMHHVEMLPDVFANYFTVNRSIHSYNTRAKDDIHVFNSNLSFGRKCVAAKAGYLWNTLPDYLKTNMSVKLFKRKLWFYLISVE